MARSKAEVINAFRPDSEMDDPDLFSGREQQLVALADSLVSTGSCPMILGDRGLGKSSLARQVQRVAMGDSSLLERYGRESSAIPEDQAYIALYLGCTDAIHSTSELLRRLTSGVMAVATDKRGDKVRLVDKTTKTRLSFKLFSYERSKRWAPQSWAPRRLDTVADYEQALVDATTRLSDIYECRVLLIIDELDRVEDKTGLASFIKVATNASLKFMLVGIAQNIGDLLADHQSIERVVAPTFVPQMERPELVAIVDRAMHRLRRQGVEMRFHPDAAGQLAAAAGGFPWFVHVLGQAALVEAYDAVASEVNPRHIASAVGSLTSNRFAQQFSDLYQRAVGESWRREVALRAFSKWNDRDIPTSGIYPVLRAMGVNNPSEYRRQLSTDHPVLQAAPFRPQGLVRFRNEMFKIYVRIRGSIYEGLDERVNLAWRAYHDEMADNDRPAT